MGDRRPTARPDETVRSARAGRSHRDRRVSAPAHRVVVPTARPEGLLGTDHDRLVPVLGGFAVDEPLVAGRGSPRTEQMARGWSTYSAEATRPGIGSNGSSRTVWSVPETRTRRPSAASSSQATTRPTEKKFVSSSATTASPFSASRIPGRGPPVSTTSAPVRRPTWLPMVAVLPVVDGGGERRHVLAGDLGPAQPPEQLLDLVGEHTPRCHLPPPAVRGACTRGPDQSPRLESGPRGESENSRMAG